MKQVDKKDAPEVSGGVMPGDDGGCTGPPLFPPWEPYPRNPFGPFDVPNPICPDQAE